MSVPGAFHRYQPDLIAELKSAVGPSPLPLYQMMRYHLGWIDEQGQPGGDGGGKMLRPTLCLLACETAGGDWHHALPAAAAVELIHNFSLIHDDIEDASPERRHRPTVWRLWGQPQAINAGDAMYALARLSLFRLQEQGTSPEKVLKALRALDQTCLELCRGQYLDISYEGRLDIETGDYLEMIAAKTAALMECALYLGALLGSEDEPAIGRLGSFGQKLGMAYQIRDDVLGIWGQEQATGKPSQSDIQRRKKTLPVIYGLARASGRQREELLNIYRKEIIEEGDAVRVVRALDRLGARDFARRVAEQYYGQALAELTAAHLYPAQAELREVAAFIMGYDY